VALVLVEARLRAFCWPSGTPWSLVSPPLVTLGRTRKSIHQFGQWLHRRRGGSGLSIEIILVLTSNKSAYRAITLLPIRILDYQYHISTAFPHDVPVGQCTELYRSGLEQRMVEHLDSRDGVLKKLLVVDYRYTRYALDPRTGLFHMVK